MSLIQPKPNLVQDTYVFEKYLLVDSRDRGEENFATYQQLPVNNFTYFYPVDSTNVSYFALEACNIENYFNNINEYNNKITIVSAVSGTYTIPIGNYTLANMIAAINAAIAPSGVSLVLTALTGLITVTGTSAFTWTSGNPNTNDYILLNMLGFDVYPLVGNLSVTARLKPTKFYTRYLDFQSARLTTFCISDESTSKKSRNGILRLFVNTDDETITYAPKLLVKYKFEPSSLIGYLDMSVIDEWGLPAQLLGDYAINFILFKKTNILSTFII